MQIGDIIKRSNQDSTQVSTIIRQLCLAGIAIIWVFGDKSQAQIIPKELVRPMLLLIIASCLDLTQYLWNFIILKVIYHFLIWNGHGDGDDYNYPSYLSLPTYIFLIGKLYFMAKAYFLIGGYLYTKLPESSLHYWL